MNEVTPYSDDDLDVIAGTLINKVIKDHEKKLRALTTSVPGLEAALDRALFAIETTIEAKEEGNRLYTDVNAQMVAQEVVKDTIERTGEFVFLRSMTRVNLNVLRHNMRSASHGFHGYELISENMGDGIHKVFIGKSLATVAPLSNTVVD